MRRYDLDDILQPGISFSLFWSEGNRNTQRVHVRGIIDDDQVVVRVWSSRGRRWVYRIDDRQWYVTVLEAGRITDVHTSK